MNKIICKKIGCIKKAVTGFIYCSKEHAPLGRYGEIKKKKPMTAIEKARLAFC